MQINQRVFDLINNFLQHEIEGGYVECWIKKDPMEDKCGDGKSPLNMENLEFVFRRDVIVTKEGGKLHISYDGGNTHKAGETGLVYLELYSKNYEIMLSQYCGAARKDDDVTMPAGGFPILLG